MLRHLLSYSQKMVTLAGLKKEIVDKLVKDLGIQTMTEGIPLDVVESIQPVFNVNEEHICDVVRNVTSNTTIYTTPSDKDFFLTGLSLHLLDTGSSGYEQINVTLEDGSVKNFAILTQAYSVEPRVYSLDRDFTYPIKLKRGTNITTTGSAVTFFSASIQGYTKEVK